MSAGTRMESSQRCENVNRAGTVAREANRRCPKLSRRVRFFFIAYSALAKLRG